MAKRSNSKQASKKFNLLIFIIALSLVLGGIVGYFTGWALIKNDKFVINGESIIEVFIGESYEDEGAIAISFGKDVSSKIKTESNVNYDEEGNYYIKYTVDNIRYRGVERYRTIIVKAAAEEAHVEVQYEKR